MNAWQKRKQLSHNENGLEDHRVTVSPNAPTSSRGSPDSGPSRKVTSAVAPLFSTRSKTLATLLYVVGVLATILFVHGGWFRLPDADIQALDRTVFAGGVLVLTLWLFPWHRFGRNVLLIPVCACLALTTLAVYFSGGWQSPLAVLFLLIVVFCAGYFSAGIAVLCVGVTLLATPRPQHFTPDSGQPTKHLIIHGPTYPGSMLAWRYSLW